MEDFNDSQKTELQQGLQTAILFWLAVSTHWKYLLVKIFPK